MKPGNSLKPSNDNDLAKRGCPGLSPRGLFLPAHDKQQAPMAF